MNLSAGRICRGCIREVTGDPVSLLRPGVRKLYEKCTYQSVCFYRQSETAILEYVDTILNHSLSFYLQLPDHEKDTGPQLICRECLKKCQNWLLFKTICNENEKLYTSNETQEELEPSDSVDGGLSVVLKVEEDEDDLLALLFNEMKYARVRHNCKGRLDPDAVSFHSIAEATKTNDKVQEDNPMETYMPMPPISISPDSIELRLSLLMGLPMEGIEEDENKRVPYRHIKSMCRKQ